jgi:hypothetical protein
MGHQPSTSVPERLRGGILRLVQRWQSASDLRRAGFVAGFCACLFVFVNWRDYCVDTISQALVPVRVWRAGTFDLDPYRGYYEELRQEGKAYSFTESADGHLYAKNSVFVSLLVAPLYLPPVVLGVPTEDVRFWIAWGRLCAALWTGVAMGLVYLTLSRKRHMAAAALGLTLLLAFGTCVWTTVAHTIYDHLGAVVCVAALVFVLHDFPLKPWRAGLVGLLAGAAVGMRLTTVVLLLPLGLYVFCRPGLLAGWRARLLAVLGVGVVPLCNALFNFWMFGAWTQTGYSADLIDRWTTPLGEGALGLLLAPNSGLLVQSPFVVLALIGGWAAWRDPGVGDRGLLCTFTICFVAYWLFYARWYDWQGGFVPSTRMLCDGYPLWMPLALLGWERVRHRPGARPLLAAAAAWSVLYQVVGISVFDGLAHRDTPPNLPWQPWHHFWVEHAVRYGPLSTLGHIARTLALFGLCAAVTAYVLARVFLPARRGESQMPTTGAAPMPAQPLTR